MADVKVQGNCTGQDLTCAGCTYKKIQKCPAGVALHSGSEVGWRGRSHHRHALN
jgi:hypothetical protein